MKSTSNTVAWVLRPPDVGEAASIHQLILDCPPLDPNSLYAYLLLTDHHAATCVTAWKDDCLCGFLSAYRLPTDPETLFVWQMAVHASQRGQQLAGAMLDHVLSRDALAGVRYVQTTISPSNSSSQRVFARLAEARQTVMVPLGAYDADLFGGSAHESEIIYLVGPFHG
ncbi:diaminobutyrate acetyltransferase [Chitinibacteraceae bacterium HSL-7]